MWEDDIAHIYRMHETSEGSSSTTQSHFPAQVPYFRIIKRISHISAYSRISALPLAVFTTCSVRAVQALYTPINALSAYRY